MQSLQYYINKYWAFCSEHPYVLQTQHTALYFYIISLSERLGNPPEFKLPTTVAMLHLSIKRYETYKVSLAILIEHGLVYIIKWSQNQYQATTISLISTPKINDVPKISTSKNNGVLKISTSTNNGVLKTSTPKINNASSKHHILEENNNIKNIWCTNNCAENGSIILTNFSTNKDSKSVNSNDPLKISPPNLLEKTNEDYKQAALTESGFINTFKGMFKNDDYLPGWLLEFNKWLAFCGKIHKNDAEYRIHFNHWIITVPGYKTAMPGDYSIIKSNKTKNNKNLSATDEYWINLALNKDG